MTIHVVCLDGTGQIKRQPNPTNISQIFDALGGTPHDALNGSWETTSEGVTGKYLAGVGTQGDPVLKILGNAFGDGIAEPIIRGYTYLSRSYQPGDEIIISGFSRGATAARALAGMVVKQGLLAQGGYNPDLKTDAYLRAVAAWYLYRGPQSGFVQRMGFHIISGIEGLHLPQLAEADFTQPPKVTAVAVFDTVSSLGLAFPTFGPHGFGAAFDFSICDTNLSPDIPNGFHALSADETRDIFGPTFWTARDGVVQQIFPGCHSDVGGGFPNRGLSDGALAWMLEQLQGVGLPFNAGALDPPLQPNAIAPAENDAAKFPFYLTPRSARAFPKCAVPNDTLEKRRGKDVEMLPSVSPAPYQPIGTYADGRPL